MSFRYALQTVDGDDAGEFKVAVPNWSVGETFLTGDGRHLRIVKILPLIDERPESVFDAAWMVEPVEPV